MNAVSAFNIVALRGRWVLVFAALSAAAGYWFLNEPLNEPEISRSHPPHLNSSVRSPESAPGIASAVPEQGRDIVDLFAPRTWEPPQTTMVAVPAPPMPPQAPPLPFKFFGRIVDIGQAPAFILTRGTEMITVRVGDRIESAYLVDKFDGSQLHLLYLPLDIRQTIFVGNANE